PRGGGVSRRIEGEERNELRDTLAQLDIPEGMSLIARTAGIGRSAEEFQWDLSYLLRIWKAIDGAAKQIRAPELIYLESNLITRAIRDHFSADIGEILIDTEDVYEQARAFMENVMPANVNKVKLYRDDVPLFSRFQIEHQIESAFSRQVNLPSGGAIVIDHTEALVSVDVNSARATKGSDVEQTAFNTNLEAADEVARQMRLRDLGGLIVIDFIDMENPKHQREVENRLREALHHDRARVQTGKISRFGLLEMSRQRLQPSLGETSYNTCPRCHGTGHIRGTESSALHILRILQEEAMKENTGAVHVQLPVDVATFLLNEKRVDIHAIESRLKVNVVLIPNIHMETPNYTLTRLRHDELNQRDVAEPSYKMATVPETETIYQTAQAAAPARQEAAVKSIAPPPQPAPVAVAQPVVPAAAPSRGSLFDRIFGWFKKRGDETPSEPAAEAAVPPLAAVRSDHNGERRERKPSQRRSRSEGRSSEPLGEVRATDARNGEKRNETRASTGRNETRASEAREPKQPRPPRQPKPSRPEADVAQAPRAVAAAPAESAGEEKRESRNRRGRGRRGRGEGRSENGTLGTAVPHAIIETAGYRAVIEVARPARSAAADQAAPAQQVLQLETAAPVPAPTPSVVTATPASVLAQLAAGNSDLQQVETQSAATASATNNDTEPGRPRRRRRPLTRPDTEPVSLQQVETSVPVANTVEPPASAPAPHPTRRRARPQVPPAQEPLIQVETHTN
ncbi:MAG: Rne/Rng family ribonuclease, partial [Thiobacillus sp.]|nr:Rne/Rng family ribonuclease [Thiobacillus sp.]